MAAAPRKTNPPIEIVADEAPKSRYARMRDEARAKQKPTVPYEFDGTEPPTLISMPESVERVTAIAELLDGEIGYGDMRRLFTVFCGAAFPAVWAVIKDDPFEVLIELVNDMNKHFNAVPAEDGEDLPGGA